MCHFSFSVESESNLQMVGQNIFGWPKKLYDMAIPTLKFNEIKWLF